MTIFNVLTSALEEVSQLRQLWESARIWIYSLGGGTIITLLIKSAIDVVGISVRKKETKATQPIIDETKGLKKDLLDVAGAMVSENKEIGGMVNNLINIIESQFTNYDLIVKTLLELPTLIITLSTAPTELKTKALETLAKIQVNLESINLLKESVAIEKERETEETPLQDIIDSEI